MRRSIMLSFLGLSIFAIAPAISRADVIVRGPFGGLIVVPSSSDVRVGPAAVTVVPAPVAPAPIPVAPAPLPIAPIPVAPMAPPPPPPPPPPPTPVVTPIWPDDFARTFHPQAGSYQVVFLHPRTHEAVPVAFVLPAGNPRVSYVANSLLFDYGRHEVEIRFQLGGKVKVMQR